MSKYIKNILIRDPLVNKRSTPYEFGGNSQNDPEELDIRVDNNLYYAILNEAIYNADLSNFTKITYNNAGVETELPTTAYTVNVTTSIIEFNSSYPGINYTYYAHYKGAGSIIWAEDVKSLQSIASAINRDTLYKVGGSNNTMSGDLHLGNNNITDVQYVDNVDIRTHTHTGLNHDCPQITADGLAIDSVQTGQIQNLAVTTAKLNTGAVVNSKIADNTIQAIKLDTATIGAGLERTSANNILKSAIDEDSITYNNNGIMQVPLYYSMVGVVLPYAGILSVPTGWLLCDGSEVLINTYRRLYNTIGNTYGTPTKGSNYFVLPNFAGKTFWGGTNVGGVEITAGLPNITGSLGVRLRPTDVYSGALYEINTGSYAESSGGDRNGRTIGFDASRSNSIYGNSTTVQPPAIQMRFIIKY